MKELELKIEELEERIAPCALNMLAASDVGLSGMLNANPNGLAGMGTAIDNSAGLGAHCPSA